MSYSKITRKGQVTIPAHLRKKHGMEEGITVKFEESHQGIIVKPLPDIADSAGKLSRYATAKDVLRDLLKTRTAEFT